MFDQVPVRVWLLVAIAAVASAPAMYVYRFLVGSPAIVGEAPNDLGWQTQRQLKISLIALCGLVALAIFIFTPAAADFARSPSFWPIVMAMFGVWGAYMTIKGLITGSVQPMIRGSFGPYRRGWQPGRYWLSMLWNAALTSFLAWAVFTGAFDRNGHRAPQEREDRCFNYGGTVSAEDSIATCSQMIAHPDKSSNLELVDLLTARGYAYNRLGSHKLALADFKRAIRLQPRHAEGYYDQGLSLQQLGEWNRAIEDYTVAARLQPNFESALFNRGYAYEHLGDLQHTVADFSVVIRLDPNYAPAYFYRGAAYKDLGNDAQAKADFASAARLDARYARMN